MAQAGASARRGLLCILGVALLAGLAADAVAREFSARDVYRAAAPSVVMVYAHMEQNTGSTGTGSVVSRDGRVLTNAHVVVSPNGRPAREIAVFFKPPRITGDMKRDLQKGYRAKIVAHSAELDLALLEVEGAPPDAAPPAERWVAPDEELVSQGIAELLGDAARAPEEVEDAAHLLSGDAPVALGALRAPRRWERLLVDAAVIGGRERWERRLDGLAREI
ncbi:MAG TPA: serine protease, partial [Myxococcota bacterium]